MKQLEITTFPKLEYGCEEEMNTLCTNLSFFGNTTKKIMVTSCEASEGKSFLAMNMMRTLSKLGKRVALVDADLRRSMMEARYGLRYPDRDAFGLTHYLAGLCELNDVVYTTNIAGVLVVPAGHEVSNSLPLLNTPRFSHLLDKLTQWVDFVLVDAPPVGIIIDAAEIAKSCDGTLFAVQYNRISRRQLLAAKQQIARSGCMVLGAVLNNVTLDSFSSKNYYNKSYYNHYHHQYAKEEKAEPKQKKQKASKEPKINAQ